MKKRRMLYLVALAASVMVCGCGEFGAGNPANIINLPEYKGLTVERLSTEVTKEDVENRLISEVGALVEPEKVIDRDEIKSGDIANIDYVGTLDGVAFDGGTAKGYDLEIGSHSFIDGFEDGLIGAKVGETKALDLTFPEIYPNNTDLAGKAVVFEVTVNSISKRPEITDDIIEKITNGDVKTVDEYRSNLEDKLIEEAKNYADSEMSKDLWNQVVEGSTLNKDLPAELLEEKANGIRKNAEEYAKAYNMDVDTYITQGLNMSKEEFDDLVSKVSDAAAKESYVLKAVALAEGIEITEDELNAEIQKYVDLYDYASQDEFKEKVNMDDFEESLLLEKVKKLLVDNANIVEKSN